MIHRIDYISFFSWATRKLTAKSANQIGRLSLFLSFPLFDFIFSLKKINHILDVFCKLSQILFVRMWAMNP